MEFTYSRRTIGKSELDRGRQPGIDLRRIHILAFSPFSVRAERF